MYNRGERFKYLMESHNGKFSEGDLDRIKYDFSYHPDGIYEKKFAAMYNLDETKYPDIADPIQKLKKWDRKGNADNMDAALAMVTHDFLRLAADAPFAIYMVRQAYLDEQTAVDAIRKAKKLLLKTHGTLDVPLGDVQRLIRGEKSLPAHGLREVPRATDTKLYDKKKGIYQVTGGDGYIQVARFGKDGTEVRSINALGASNHPESPHYNDQMEMFTNHQYRTIHLDRSRLERSAERVYHPGE